MSSPFKIFRKHQKVLLVVAGLMAMIAFVILPIVLQNFSMRRSNTDPVVVTTTKYGNLTRGDIQNLRYRHDCVVGILSGVFEKLYGPMEEPRFRQVLERVFGGNTEPELVDQWLRSKKAAEIGVRLSDENITDLLTNTDDAFANFFRIREKALAKITTKDIHDIFGRYQHLTEDMFYEMLRKELEVYEFNLTVSSSITGATPGQRWEYFRRTHKQAEIECIAVPVAQFAASTAAPKEDDLKAYFEKYKDRTPSPDSAEPGFRVPQKVELEYFVANVDEFASPEKVTDEEIQTYYEKNREQYDRLNKQYLDEEAKKAAEKKEPAAQEGEKKETSEPGKPAEAEKPAENVTPAPAQPEKKDADKPQGEPTPPPATDKPADNSPEKPADKPQEKPADKPEEKSSSVEHARYHFVSLAADEDKKDTPEQPKPEEPKTEAPKTETPVTEPPKTETPATEAPKADTPKTETPATEPPKADSPKTETPATEAPKTEVPATEIKPAGATDQAAPPRRQLTEEVKKVIRRRVAVDKILAIYAKLESQMKENAIDLKRYDAAKLHGDTDIKSPAKLDFESLAKQQPGITAGKTGAITIWQAQETEIGKSVVENTQQSVYALAFDFPSRRSDIAKYEPKKSGSENDIYLFWKTKESKEAVPNWDDAAVKKQVLQAWQLEQARKPALEKAKALAEEAMKSKTTLKEAFAANKELEVISPPPFTWLVGGMNPLYPQYFLNDNIKGIDFAGDEFMKTVFSLDPQGVGTAMNRPQTIAYVIQVQKFDPSAEILWKKFTEDDYNLYADAARGDQLAAGKALNDELRKEAGLEWPKVEGSEKEDSSNN